MPELPEVETTKNGITPYLLNQIIEQIVVRQPNLRLTVPEALVTRTSGQKIIDISRRSKYLILHLTTGSILIHLGMSGYLRLTEYDSALKKHDHIDLVLKNKRILRYHDPRRFGLWLFTSNDPFQHPLLSRLGPEPLTEDFNGEYLYKKAIGRKQNIKSFIMTNEIVVGVGNIYATECLYLSRIHPMMPAGKLSLKQMNALTTAIKQILTEAIRAGGTTLKDFYTSDGTPGYFALNLNAYGRQGQPCYRCSTPIKAINIAGRKSAFCPVCQYAV